jgi:hypothetical protein
MSGPFSFQRTRDRAEFLPFCPRKLCAMVIEEMLPLNSKIMQQQRQPSLAALRCVLLEL